MTLSRRHALATGASLLALPAGLAAAQYRLGRFQKEFLPKALATLGRCDPNDLVGLALLAMTQHRLGEKDQARTSLAHLRVVLNTPRGPGRADAEELCREAARLIEGPKDPPAN